MYLPDIRTVVMSVPWQEARQRSVKTMLTELGFKDHSFYLGVKAKPYWQGCRTDVLAVLTEHDFSKGPLLILEDDVKLLPVYWPTIEPPPDARVIYLGGTRNGEHVRHKVPGAHHMPAFGPFRRSVSFADIPDHPAWMRPLNMHSAHAMLFRDVAAAKLAINAINKHKAPHDVAYARDMIGWPVAVLRHPFWYQADGHNDAATRNYCPEEVHAPLHV